MVKNDVRNTVAALILLAIMICAFSAFHVASAQSDDITSSFEDTGTIKSGEVKAFHFPGNDMYLELEVTTSSQADFYIFTESGYSMYCNPAAQFFYPEKSGENRMSFSWSEKLTEGYYLVIDNDFISESGAEPTGTISYDISVGLDTVRPLNPIQENCFLIMVIAGIVIVAILVFLFRTPKNVELPPPPVPETMICPGCGLEVPKGQCPICQPQDKG